jgi:cell wall-associated NlpC family hydrolase
MEPWEHAIVYLGVPFQHMGRSEKGLDCVGLLVLVARELGIEVQDSPHYGREPARNNNSFQLADYLRLHLGDPVEREPRINDVLLMKLRPRFAPAHVGIVAPHPYGLALIHSYGQIGKVVLQRIDERRDRQIVGVYQWPAKP